MNSESINFIDTHEIAKELEHANFSEEQVDAIIKANNQYFNSRRLATKDDLEILKKDIIIKLSGIMFAMLLAFKILDKFI